MQLGWNQAARIRYIPQVPQPVAAKWLSEERALEVKDAAQIRNESNRNELERHTLQLRKSTRASGIYGQVMTGDERAEIGQRLAAAEAMLATDDATPQVRRSRNPSQDKSARFC